MSLPFSHDQFLDVFVAYNSALWPWTLALWLITVAAVVLLATGRAKQRFIAGLLAIHWLWSGAVYHLGYFAEINPAARLFGILFILEACLIAWFGVARSRLEFVWGRGRGLRGIVAVVLILYALAYPLLALASGMVWPRMPAFAVPCPTALLTVGLLLSAEPGHLRGLTVIPIAWTAIGGSAAILLGVLPDLALLVAGAALLLQLFAPRVLFGARAA